MDKLITHDALALSNFMIETIFVKGEEEPGQEPVADVDGGNVLLTCLGGNARHFVFVVHEPAHPFMAPDELEALKKMLAASGMSIDDVAVINTAGGSLHEEQLRKSFEPVQLVFLGVDPLQTGISGMQINQPMTWRGVQVLYTFSFREMMGNTEKKKLFWERFKALKKNDTAI